jgi:hypothetical protein
MPTEEHLASPHIEISFCLADTLLGALELLENCEPQASMAANEIVSPLMPKSQGKIFGKYHTS